MQEEFSFTKPWIDAQTKRDEAYNQFFKVCIGGIQGGYNIRDLFKDIPEPDMDGPSIPMFIVKGYKDQPQFDFVRPIDEAAWDFPILYDGDNPAGRRGVSVKKT